MQLPGQHSRAASQGPGSQKPRAPRRPRPYSTPRQGGDNELPGRSQGRQEVGDSGSVQAGAAEGGARGRARDGAAAVLQAPSGSRGSGQGHLQRSSGEDRGAKPPGARLQPLERREGGVWGRLHRVPKAVATRRVVAQLGLGKEVPSKK